MSETQAARRESLSLTDDSRAVQTRTRLTTAFHEAALEHQTDVTVTWLCDRAGVARSTFYTHYSTVDDLALAALGEFFAEAVPFDAERRASRELELGVIARQSMELIIKNLWEGRELVRFTMAMGSKAAIQERLIDDVATDALTIVRVSLPELDEADVRIRADWLAAGTVVAALRWIVEPKDVTPEHVVEQLVGLMPRWLAGEAAQ
ncbi:MAG: putative HTH-type transcriptional regulator [Subtercola sp.]|nr:putative HTH-type transcriptional regulator [Subtercola sp.]